jgi:mono/diheme cytochrome c family protein
MNRTLFKFAFAFAVVAVAGVGLASAVFITPKPAQAHADAKARGAEVFSTSGCTHCHGATAQGTDKGPSLRGVRSKLTGEQMHKQIVEGGKSMPAFGDALQEEQIAAVIAMLRDKHPEKLLERMPADKTP